MLQGVTLAIAQPWVVVPRPKETVVSGENKDGNNISQAEDGLERLQPRTKEAGPLMRVNQCSNVLSYCCAKHWPKPTSWKKGFVWLTRYHSQSRKSGQELKAETEG